MYLRDKLDAKSVLSKINHTGCGNDLSVTFRFDARAAFVPLSRLVLDSFVPGPYELIIDEYGVWPSSENWFLFDNLCERFFGRTHRMEVMNFCGSEIDAAQTFLHLALQFGWGGALVSAHQRYFKFNHDGFGLILSSKRNRLCSDLKRIPGLFEVCA